MNIITNKFLNPNKKMPKSNKEVLVLYYDPWLSQNNNREELTACFDGKHWIHKETKRILHQIEGANKVIGWRYKGLFFHPFFKNFISERP